MMKNTLSRTQESNVQAVFGGDKEVTWLSSTAWNMGYNAAKVDDYEGTYQFLSIAYQVTIRNFYCTSSSHLVAVRIDREDA